VKCCAPRNESGAKTNAVITETGLDIHRYICSALFGGAHLLLPE
jgi:hypothetical protein